MKFTVAAAVLGLAAAVAAQTDIDLTQVPRCAYSCVSLGLPKQCGVDPKCICSDTDFLGKASCCLLDACTKKEDQDAVVAFGTKICSSVGVDVAGFQCPDKKPATTSAEPTTTEAPKPTTTEEAKATTEEAKPTTTEEAQTTTEEAKPTTTEEAKATTEEAKPTTTEEAKTTTEEAKPTTTEASKPATTEEAKSTATSASAPVVPVHTDATHIPTTLATSAPAASGAAPNGGVANHGAPGSSGAPAPIATYAPGSNGASSKAASAGALALAAGAFLL